MKIEEGRYYRTRDGRKVGPARRDAGTTDRFVLPGDHPGYVYYIDGTYAVRDHGDDLDLVSEWEEPGPVRTVTRKEIVPGVYGRVRVFGAHSNGAAVGVRLTVGERSGNIADMNPAELRAAAATLLTLADALEEPAQP